MQDNRGKNIIVDMSFDFSLKIIGYVNLLEKERKYVLATQILKSGTSIGANIREAQNAESKNDFIHKMKVAAKEADETMYWLQLCMECVGYPKNSDLLNNCDSLIRVLSKIIATAKRGLLKN